MFLGREGISSDSQAWGGRDEGGSGRAWVGRDSRSSAMNFEMIDFRKIHEMMDAGETLGEIFVGEMQDCPMSVHARTKRSCGLTLLVRGV
ncbi:hypothetical protein R1flu_021380 [Riccia fluitans]|uniref:Uncharacterized protein n=1 Tax=Riccia fluitans TaxID=41844 RepID=A0ABD1ZP66_9MARC